MRILVFFIFVLSFYTGCADKPTGTSTLGSVHGIIMDASTNNGLAGVIVSIENSGNTLTNSVGYYEFKDLREDLYTITAGKTGYITERKQIEIEANKKKEVNFILHKPEPAYMVVSPLSLNFGQVESNLNLTIKNSGQTELNWQVISDKSWLSVFPSSGTTNAEEDKIAVSVNRNGLEVGSYSGNLAINSNGGNINVPVMIEVTSALLNVSKTLLDFGENEATMSFIISNSGGGVLNWSLSSNRSWISANPPSGSITTNTPQIEVTVDRTGLASGSYSGSVLITSNGGSREVVVNMSIPETVNIIEHFNNLDSWVNTTKSSEAWVIDPSGYNGSCAKSVCGGYGYGDKLSQSFYFSTNVVAKLWVRKEGYDYIRIYFIVDGTIMWAWGGGGTWGSDWVQLQCSIPSGQHTIEIETDFAGTAWIDELEISSN